MEVANWIVYSGIGIVFLCLIMIVIFALRLKNLPNRKEIYQEFKDTFDAKVKEYERKNNIIKQEIERLKGENENLKNNKYLSNLSKKGKNNEDGLDF